MTSVPTAALIPSSTSSSTGVLQGQRQDHRGQQVLQVPDACVGAGHGSGVVAGVRGQRRGEGHVVSGAPGPDGGQDRGEPGAEVGIAHPRGRVVDGRVDPGILSPCRSSSAGRDAALAAEFPASQRASRTAA